MTTKAFGAQLLSLPEIFKDNFFTIPDYQRGYAWDDKQVKELLSDIEHLMSDRSTLRHYTGTLVLSQPDKLVAEHFHVVDGQQRLTTLTVFLHQLCLRLPEEQRSEFEALYLVRGALGNEQQVLNLNADTRNFFESVVLKDGNTERCPISLDAHKRLLSASKLIGKWLDSQTFSDTDINEIKRTLEERLGFLVYAPEEDAETGIMFEVINNRGKSLSELEKVKNYLIYCCVKLSANTLRHKIDTEWSYILQALSKAKRTSPGEESAFLRYCLVVHLRLNKTDSQYGYEQLKKNFDIGESLKNTSTKETLMRRIEGLVEFMKTASLWYQRLYAADHRDIDPEIAIVLDQLRAQRRHASIMPIFLALVIKHQGKGQRLLKLLRLVEILNFRVYMARGMTARNDTGQGNLYWYASHYFHNEIFTHVNEHYLNMGKEIIGSDDDALEFFLVYFIHEFATQSRFKESFLLERDSPDDFYKWGGLRYFLMNYEANLQPKKTIKIDKILLSSESKKTADYLSVEHLWATKNRCGEGENNRKSDKYQRRRLGNFVLLELRLNIQGCNDDLEDKLPRYLEGFDDEAPTDLQQVRKMARNAKTAMKNLEGRQRRINFFHDLHSELNDYQEKRYIDFALKRWSLKGYLGDKQLTREAAAEAESE